jgi:hypothetical protein
MDGRGEIGYSRRMTNDIAPPIPTTSAPRQRVVLRSYPDPSTRLGRAWQYAWKHLAENREIWVDGNELADVAAETEGLSAATMVGVLTRAATAGVLERTHVTVDGTRGPRKRTQYRIPQS